MEHTRTLTRKAAELLLFPAGRPASLLDPPHQLWRASLFERLHLHVPRAAAAEVRRRLEVSAAQEDDSDYRTWGNLGDALSALPATAAQARAPYERAARMAQRQLERELPSSADEADSDVKATSPAKK